MMKITVTDTIQPLPLPSVHTIMMTAANSRSTGTKKKPYSFLIEEIERSEIALKQGQKRTWMGLYAELVNTDKLKDCLHVIELAAMMEAMSTSDFINAFGEDARIIAWASCALDRVSGLEEMQYYPVLKINDAPHSRKELVICWNWWGTKVDDTVMAYFHRCPVVVA